MEIGIWGDSITYGAGDKEALGWVGRIRKELYEADCGIYNRGICGDTSEDLLRRFEVERDSIEPDVIVFAIGINDSKFPNGGVGNKVAFSVFQENIRKLITLAQSSKAVIVIGLTEVDEKNINSPSIFKNEVIKQYDRFLEEFSKGQDVTFVSMQGVLDMDSDLEDGLHPNAAGYQKMFKAILPSVIVAAGI